MERQDGASYIPITPHPPYITLIGQSRDHCNGKNLRLKDLLLSACNSNVASMFIFEVPCHGTFLLWIARSETSSTNTLNDATAMLQRLFEENNQRQACVLFDPERQEHVGLPKTKGLSTLAVLAKYDQDLERLLGLHLAQEEILEHTFQSMKRRSVRESIGSHIVSPIRLVSGRALFVTCGCIFILTALLFAASNLREIGSPDKYNPWRVHDTRQSVGPKHQHSLTGRNASQWTRSYVHDEGEWVLRIDDQAIIPSHLMDEEEEHYQEWFQNRYTEMNQIRLNRDYLNETWLNSPLVDQVPADDLFHFAHCVLAVKRYIKAKVTGHHVCRRDIDHDHIRHCLNALDWWAFPSGERGETIPNPRRPFFWRTKVCFD